jgi:hypothetical protein
MSGNTQPIGDRQLDLLVDGQLKPAERRQLLTQLDAEPGAWRRCALAFLEAQAWREDFRAVARPAPAEAPSQSVAVAPRRRTASRWPAVLAVAASFIMAFTLGMIVHPSWRGSVPRLDQVARQGAAGDQGPRGALTDSASPWRMVTLTSPDASGEPIRLPAVERNRIDDAWLGSLPAAVPPDVLRAFERTGHAVHQSRQLMPVPLEDGRRLVVPVDQIEVHPVGKYQ